jgi:hypothetical protein
MLCPDRRFIQDPGNGPEADETPQDFVDTIGSEDTEALQVQMSGTTSEGRRSRKRQIDGMHSKMDKMQPNVTTMVQTAAQHLYTERYLGIFDEYTLTETNFKQQRQNNEDKLELANKGTPMQQGSIRSADNLNERL